MFALVLRLGAGRQPAEMANDNVFLWGRASQPWCFGTSRTRNSLLKGTLLCTVGYLSAESDPLVVRSTPLLWTISNASGHWKMCSGEQSHPQLRTTDLGLPLQNHWKLQLGNLRQQLWSSLLVPRGMAYLWTLKPDIKFLLFNGLSSKNSWS